MSTQQQQETQRFFEANAAEWLRETRSRDTGDVNVIRQRNEFVLETAKHEGARVKRTLDVGCGPGDLVCDLAQAGLEAEGIDFAREMIALANEDAATRGVTAHFTCASVFDFQAADGAFDLISANGFIEYISLKQLDHFLGLARRWLGPGGSLVLGSRNRLFNLSSANAFTLQEAAAGTLESLAREATIIAAGIDPGQLSSIVAAPPQPSTMAHPDTGVTVETRFQFTPAQLASKMSEHGFTVTSVSPIHIHTAPPAFKLANPKLHSRMSAMLQEVASSSMALLPMASSFMMHARRS